MLPAGDQDEVEHSSTSSWSPAGPKHVELIEIINTIITVASSWLFILLAYSVVHT